MSFKDVPTKKYDDGSVGNYFCTCTVCGEIFIGHKRDFTCPREHPAKIIAKNMFPDLEITDAEFTDEGNLSFAVKLPGSVRSIKINGVIVQ